MPSAIVLHGMQSCKGKRSSTKTRPQIAMALLPEPPLLSIPQEVLELILEEVAAPHDTNELRKLRFVCKSFANSHAVQGSLFRSINLIADLKHLTWMGGECGMSRIAPFVRHVNFVPPIYALMEFADFERILERQAEWKYGCYENIEPPRRSGRTRKSRRNEAFLHTKKQLKAGYKKYDNWAVLAFLGLEENAFEKEWVKALKLFHNCKS
jgi:hypothetical protein